MDLNHIVTTDKRNRSKLEQHLLIRLFQTKDKDSGNDPSYARMDPSKPRREALTDLAENKLPEEVTRAIVILFNLLHMGQVLLAAFLLVVGWGFIGEGFLKGETVHVLRIFLLASIGLLALLPLMLRFVPSRFLPKWVDMYTHALQYGFTWAAKKFFKKQISHESAVSGIRDLAKTLKHVMLMRVQLIWEIAMLFFWGGVILSLMLPLFGNRPEDYKWSPYLRESLRVQWVSIPLIAKSCRPTQRYVLHADAGKRQGYYFLVSPDAHAGCPITYDREPYKLYPADTPVTILADEDRSDTCIIKNSEGTVLKMPFTLPIEGISDLEFHGLVSADSASGTRSPSLAFSNALPPPDFSTRWFMFAVNVILIYGLGVRFITFGVSYMLFRRQLGQLDKELKAEPYSGYFTHKGPSRPIPAKPIITPLRSMTASVSSDTAKVPEKGAMRTGRIVLAYNVAIKAARSATNPIKQGVHVYDDVLDGHRLREKCLQHIRDNRYTQADVVVDGSDTIDRAMKEFVGKLANYLTTRLLVVNASEPEKDLIKSNFAECEPMDILFL